MRLLLTISLLLCLCTAWAGGVRMLITRAPLAGSQYYAVAELWPELKTGDLLTLVREPDNRHDGAAIRVEWHGRKLGYLPRASNHAVAAAMDAGDRLIARIAKLSEASDPWQRVEIEVLAEL
jgi:hypothetical protein